MPSSHSFELSAATLGGEYLDASRWTMLFVDATAEADFLRFRNRGRVAVDIATMGLHTVYYAIVALTFDNTARVVFSVLAVIALATMVLQIVFVACRAPATVDEEAAVARRQERISVVGYSVIIVLVMSTYPLTAVESCAASNGDPQECRYSKQGASAMMPFVTMALAPRFSYLAPMNALAVITGTASAAVFGFFPILVDHVIDALVALGFMATFCLAGWAIEARQREHLRSIVWAQRSDALIAREAADTRAVLAAVLPSPLLRDGAKLNAAHYRRASVVITDIYDFAQWSTGYLEVDVVMVLHVLIAGYDAAVDGDERVERAMSYGDCYVVCAGLLEAEPEHGIIARQFAAQLRSVAAATSASSVRSFAVRCAVCSGELVGGAVGKHALRYVVAGPAFDAAKLLLEGCAPGDVAVAADSFASAVANAPEPGASNGRERAVVDAHDIEGGEVGVADVDHIEAIAVGDEPSPRNDDGRAVAFAHDGAADGTNYALSALWLTFADAAVQRRMERAAVAGVATALARAVIISAITLTVLIELALSSPRRHHTRQPVGFALLCVSLAVSWAHVALLKVSPDTWGKRGRANVAVAFVAQASFGASLALIDCYFAEPSSFGVIALAALRCVDGVSWLVQTALFLAATFPPAWYWDLYVNKFFAAPTVFTTFVAAPMLVIIYRYFVARAACQQFAAQDVAQASLLRAADTEELLDRLLTGLMPAHVPHGARYQERAVGVQQPAYSVFWRGMSILQLHVAFLDHSRGFRVIADAWSAAAGSIGKVCAALELVQSTGDSFLIAGPFLPGLNDDAAVAAARGAVDTLRAIADALMPLKCHVTAVATAGNAYGSLVGAALLTYRLFGAAVRENDAIMAAAPRAAPSSPLRPFDARAQQGTQHPNVFFLASNSFVQQERNFVVPHAVSVVADGGMSTVVAPHASVAAWQAESFASPTEAAASVERAHRVTFAAPKPWRVRGLGVSNVSTVSKW
jgi:class 3 adenylate cyclase